MISSKKIKASRLLFILGTIAVLGILIGGAFEAGRYSMYQQYPELSQTEQAKNVLAEVSKLIELPQNENPQIATITDAATIKKEQPFLVQAENDDIVIVYPTSQMAILYRPSTNKLIAVGPVATEPATKTVNSEQPTTHATSTPKK